MATWRGDLLASLGVDVPGLVLVDDPDGLLLDPGVAALLADHGVMLVHCEDPMAFRYAYETELRHAAAPVVVRAGDGGAAALPWDVLRRGRHVRLGLDRLFPSFHHATVAAFGVEILDRLADLRYEGPPLGERDTLDMVLRHVMGIDVRAVGTPERLLRLLLQRHYAGESLPPVLDAYLVEALRMNPAFAAWPLHQIVPGREAFFRFLQERWPLFVASRIPPADGSATVQEREQKPFTLPGPLDLPFDHADVRAYIDSLFLEGHLKVVVPPGPADEAGWLSVGLDLDPERARLRRVQHLLEVLREALPPSDAPHTAWLSYAIRWGQLMADVPLLVGTETTELAATAERFGAEANERFVTWVRSRYDGLRTMPAAPPVMLHHVARYIAMRRARRGPDAKVALVLMDGLALEQWVTLARALEREAAKWRFETGAVFAWLPTLTAVSRQAVFAGRPPHAYPDSIDTSSRDATAWQAFWSEHGLTRSHVHYLDVKGEAEDVVRVRGVLNDDRVQVLGLVVRMVDEIVHGAELGRAGVQQAVRLWAEKGVPDKLLRLLLESGFEVYLTSDHGNAEAVGMGRPEGGLLAKERAERARVYSSITVRDQIAASVPGSIAWTPAGLPAEYETLFPPVGAAFTNVGKHLVTHGGISIEELIVPFVHLGLTPQAE